MYKKWVLAVLVLVLLIPAVSGQTDFCRDSDTGENYFQKGSAYGLRDGKRFTVVDSCADGNTVNEAYCEGDAVKTTNFYCLLGCFDGACKEKGELPTIQRYTQTVSIAETIPAPSGGGGSVGQCSDLIDMDACLDVSVCYWDQETNACYGYDDTKQKCSEDDGWADKDVQGHTYGFRKFYANEKDKRIRTGGLDACFNDFQLIEHYCIDDYYIAQEYIQCLNGCDEGACKKERPIDYPEKGMCEETDDGFDIYVSGKTTGWYSGAGEVITASDYCVTEHGGTKDGILAELYCEDNEMKEKFVDCEAGCVGGQYEGACAREVIVCTDTDGGENYFVQGTTRSAKFSYSAAPITWTDMCLRDYDQYQQGSYVPQAGITEKGGLLEGSCGPNLNEPGVIRAVECPAGCDNGACARGVAMDCGELEQKQQYYFDVCIEASQETPTADYGAVCFDKYNGTYMGCGPVSGDGCTFNNMYAENNIACPVYVIEKYEDIIERDFPPFTYTGTTVYDWCDILLTGDCKLFIGIYDSTIEGVERVGMQVEVHTNAFSAWEALDAIKGRRGTTTPQEGSWYGNNYIVYDDRPSPNQISLMWYSGNKVLALGIIGWDETKVDDDVFEPFFEAYFRMYPSDVVFDAVVSVPVIAPIPECRDGCLYVNRCIPISVRVEGLYCDISGNMLKQKGAKLQCENSFECTSNFCLDGRCTTKGFWQKIINLLAKLL